MLTNGIESQGQTIKNRSEMKIESQEMNKIFLGIFFNIQNKLELKY